ncbi:MAG: hypothetical protein N2112_07265 [Gemmataceae bacterium]|jgi:uncharacterized Zn finger protein (UPF0148 family)|nr:hypothetical protein [Gemmataceae bacterium]
MVTNTTHHTNYPTQITCQVCGNPTYQTRGESRCTYCGFSLCLGCEMSEPETSEESPTETE